MSDPLLIPLPGNQTICQLLAEHLALEIGDIEVRRFPDGESYVRYGTALNDRPIVLICSLDKPDDKILPLIFAATTARELGARSIGLVSPYLAYMRQDRRFREGEAITSVQFAKLLSSAVDWLVTIDPHLHRYTSLDEIYSIPSAVIHAASLLSEWIANEVPQPLLIGPDSESEQWVSSVAKEANAPFLVLEKVRRGDHDVEVSVPEVDRWRNRTPVLVDDIISTGRTMIETVNHLARAGMRSPVCVAVHGVFADGAYETLRNAGAENVVSANTILHPSNSIDVTPLLAEGVRRNIQKPGTLMIEP